MRHIQSATLLFAILALVGCDVVDENEDASSGSVYVANQGNFGDGNGSVSVYDPESEDVRPAAISSLGSIVQSVLVDGDDLYVLANTGDRIDVFDTATMEQTAQIGNVLSPRYMLTRGSSGYVTSFYGEPESFSGGKVNVLDLRTNTIVDEIAVGDNPEGLALVGSRLYVAIHTFGLGSTLHVIDTGAGEVTDTIDVACDGPRFLLADADQEIFVFCTGRTVYDDEFNPIGETDGAVVVLDGMSGQILKRIEIDGRIGTAGPGQDAFFSEESNSIFAVKDETTILTLDTAQNALIGEVGPLDGAPIGAVAYDDAVDLLYVGRSNGYTEAGHVTVHSRTGEQMGQFVAGIAPAYIALGAGD